MIPGKGEASDFRAGEEVEDVSMESVTEVE